MLLCWAVRYVSGCDVSNQALINYGIAFLRKRQYSILQPPYFMNKEVMGGVAQLEQFDEELYKVLPPTPLLHTTYYRPTYRACLAACLPVWGRSYSMGALGSGLLMVFLVLLVLLLLWSCCL